MGVFEPLEIVSYVSVRGNHTVPLHSSTLEQHSRHDVAANLVAKDLCESMANAAVTPGHDGSGHREMSDRFSRSTHSGSRQMLWNAY